MKFELFIAKRIHFNKEKDKKVSRPAVRIAIGGIAMGLAVMIVAVAIVIGFKTEVRNKLIGFGSHIQVSSSYSNQTYETSPVIFDDEIKERLQQGTWIKHIQEFATQPGIINTDGNFQGIVLKGVGQDFDWDFFRSNLKSGELLNLEDTTVNKNIIISQKIADLLKIKVNDKVLAYFVIQGRVRVRPLTIQGIYATGFGDYDKLFVLCDKRIIQRLNGWDENQCSGLEILTDDYEHLDNAIEEAFDIMGNRFDKNGASYLLRSIKQINPQIFSWLDLLDMNVAVILILMALVAGFTMISGLLILILERTNMIGILKALGGSNWFIRRIFLIQSAFLIGKGLLLGNLIGISACLLQKYFSIVKLNPDVYYVESVPINLSLFNLLAINVATFALLLLITVGPSYIITKINPAQSIKFE